MDRDESLEIAKRLRVRATSGRRIERPLETVPAGRWDGSGTPSSRGPGREAVERLLRDMWRSEKEQQRGPTVPQELSDWRRAAERRFEAELETRRAEHEQALERARLETHARLLSELESRRSMFDRELVGLVSELRDRVNTLVERASEPTSLARSAQELFREQQSDRAVPRYPERTRVEDEPVSVAFLPRAAKAWR